MINQVGFNNVYKDVYAPLQSNGLYNAVSNTASKPDTQPQND